MMTLARSNTSASEVSSALTLDLRSKANSSAAGAGRRRGGGSGPIAPSSITLRHPAQSVGVLDIVQSPPQSRAALAFNPTRGFRLRSRLGSFHVARQEGGMRPHGDADRGTPALSRGSFDAHSRRGRSRAGDRPPRRGAVEGDLF